MADRVLRKKQITTKRQEQILNAATDVFVSKGYTDATIPEIARQSSLAAGTIYIYYPSKRELFIAVIENLMITPIKTIFDQKVNSDFQSTIKDAIYNRLGMSQNDVFLRLTPLMGEIQRDEELRKIYNEKINKPFFEHMGNVYRTRIETGELRKFDPELVVRFIGGMLLGINLLSNIEGIESPLNRKSNEKIANEIMHFILFGLVNSSQGNTKEG